MEDLKSRQIARLGLSVGALLSILGSSLHVFILGLLGIVLVAAGFADWLWLGSTFRAARGMHRVPRGLNEKFDVVLLSPGENRISTIRTLSEIYSLSLAQADRLADAPVPWMVRPRVSLAEADYVKSKLEAAGAEVEIRPRG